MQPAQGGVASPERKLVSFARDSAHPFQEAPVCTGHLRACNKTQIANPSGGCLHADYSTQRDYSGPIGLQPTAIDLIMKARP